MLPRAKACTECRQTKVRCDRAERRPRACTRCTQRGLRCTYRAAFVRTRKRNQSRRKQQHVGSTDPIDTERLETDAGQSPSLELLPPPVWSHSLISHPDRLPLVECFQAPQASIDGVVLDTAQVNDYLQYFFNHVHTHFPFLECPFQPAQVLETSPLLFWVVIAITCGIRNRKLYRQLQPCVRRLAAQSIYPFNDVPETCEALCLLCLWPFEADVPNDDPLFVYAGMAMHMAMQKGLHRPYHSYEFKEINNRALRNGLSQVRGFRVWCACVFVEHILAFKIGVPGGSRSYHTLQHELRKSAEDSDSFHPVIRQHVILGLLRDRYFNSIAWDGPSPSGLADPASRMTLLSLFNKELRDFATQDQPLEGLTLVLLHATHVAIAGFCLASDLMTCESQQHTQLLLLRQGVDSAVAVLDLTAPLEWETLPFHVFLAILYSGTFAAQFTRVRRQIEGLATNLEKHAVDGSLPSLLQKLQVVAEQTELDRILDRAIDTFSTLAYGRDLPTRAKIILEVLRRQSPADLGDAETRHDLEIGSDTHMEPSVDVAEQDPATAIESSTTGRGETMWSGVGVKFQSRMAASVYWDAVEHYKDSHNWNQDEWGILQEIMNRFPM